MKKIFIFLSLLLTISIISAQSPFSSLNAKHSVNKNSQWTSMNAHRTDRALDYTSVSLPFDTTFVFSMENTTDMTDLIGEPYRCVVFKFTVEEATVLSLTEENDLFELGVFYNQLDMSNMYNFDTQISTVFAPGDYYVVLADFAENLMGENVHFSIDILDITYTEIEVPYEGEVSFTSASPMIEGYYAAAYTFTTTEDMELAFHSKNGSVDLFLFSETFEGINNGSNFIEEPLLAGTYILLVINYNNVIPLSEVIYINEYINYWDMDFSQEITLGEQITGTPEDLIAGVNVWGTSSNVAAYSAQVTTGNLYKVTLNVFAPQNAINIGFYVFHENLNQNFYDDNVFYDFSAATSNSLSFVSSFTAGESEKVNFAFTSMFPEVYYTIKIDEIVPTIEAPHPGDFAFAEMTLPFAQVIGFDPTQFNNVIVDGTDIYKAYHLNIDETINLKYIIGYYTNENNNHYFATPLYIFSDETLTNSVTPYGLWNSENITLAPSDYYILFEDNGCYQMDGVYMTPLVYLDFEPATLIETVSLEELLDDPNITVVDWNNDLDYSDVGYWVSNQSTIFEDNYWGGQKFAKAYKLINMPIDTVINIHIGSSIDSYLYIYVKESDDTYTMIYSEDDGWNNIGGLPAFGNPYDSYMLFNSDPTTQMDYYIIATMLDYYNDYYYHNNSPRMTTIWKGDAPAGEPVYGEPQMPLLGEIVSTQTATTTLNFQSQVSNSEIKIVLMALEVTATTANNETFVATNNPFAWEINAEQTIATFENYSNPNYVFAANYAPATVSLVNSATSELLTIKHGLYPNPAVDNIFIDGLQVSSKISIIDLNGKIVKTLFATSQNQNILVNDLAKGTYIVSIQNGKSIDVLKFVK